MAPEKKLNYGRSITGEEPARQGVMMAATNNPKEMPETFKIAQLLAELMPEDAQPDKPAVVMAKSHADEVLVDVNTPHMTMEDMGLRIREPAKSSVIPASADVADVDMFSQHEDLPEEIFAPPAEPVKPLMPAVTPRERHIPGPVKPPALAEPPPLPPTLAEPPPLPPTPVTPPVVVPVQEPASSFLNRYNWRNESAPPPAAKKQPAPTPPAKTPELLPLGTLAASSYFALVNWRNQPDQVRHPVREQPGFDAESLIMCEGAPFHGMGSRDLKELTVSAVMAQCVWE
jgi:hypothetical protein